MGVNAENLHAIRAGRIVGCGGGTGQLKDGGGEAVGSIDAQVVGQSRAEKSVSGSDGEARPANSGQRQIVKAAANAIANSHCADKNRAGHRNAEERADMAPGMEAEVGFDQI
jgi:hypothetical protein